MRLAVCQTRSLKSIPPLLQMVRSERIGPLPRGEGWRILVAKVSRIIQREMRPMRWVMGKHHIQSRFGCLEESHRWPREILWIHKANGPQEVSWVVVPCGNVVCYTILHGKDETTVGIPRLCRWFNRWRGMFLRFSKGIYTLSWRSYGAVAFSCENAFEHHNLICKKVISICLHRNNLLHQSILLHSLLKLLA